MKDNRRTQADRSAATRAALVTAARELFAEHGFAAVSTEAIVRAAGVTRGALYHQFADKVELFAAVFEATEAELTARLDEAVGGSGLADPLAMMRFGAAAWLDACAEPAIQRIALVDGPAVLGWERWREIGLRYGLGLVQSLVVAAIETGQIDRQPPEPLSHVLLGALDEAALYVARAGTAEAAATARAETTAALVRLIEGLATTR
ncbi:MAG: TetR/AcrR family transcriptional regulator [Jatrophihabitans sp.]|uniref:TetR/AcrR family transcriptional regulator n=1 Tax=Jatrophihabitans sp. TaxID=1932789 RepID=UPI003F7F7517